MEGLGVPLSEQVNICAFDELRRLNAELGHKVVRFADTDLWGLILCQHNLKFQKVPQPFYTVEVHTRSADKEKGALFNNSTDLAVGKAQQFAERSRARRG